MGARGRRSPSRKWFIQKLNSASSSKIRILQWGLRLRSVRTDEGESFSYSRKGNEEYRQDRAGRRTGQQINDHFLGVFYRYFFSFFCSKESVLNWITSFDSPKATVSRSDERLSLNRPVKLTCFSPTWQEDFLALRGEEIFFSSGLKLSSV